TGHHDLECTRMERARWQHLQPSLNVLPNRTWSIKESIFRRTFTIDKQAKHKLPSQRPCENLATTGKSGSSEQFRVILCSKINRPDIRPTYILIIDSKENIVIDLL